MEPKLHRMLISSIEDYAIYMLSPTGVVLNWNPGAQLAKGYTEAEIVGHNYECFYSPEDRALGLPEANLANALKFGKTVTEGWRVRKDGTRFWASVVIDPVYDADTLIGFAKITRDMTLSWEANQRLLYLATHDTLTGLPNRKTLLEAINKNVGAQSSDVAVCVLYLDLDRFKPVNDTLGHHAGDEVLRETARRLQALTRMGDVVSRIGGDEFAAMILGVEDRDAVASLAERIACVMQRPFTIDGTEIVTGVSIGIAMAPHDGDSGDELLRHADLALYQVKRDGGCGHRFFERSLRHNAVTRRAMELKLRHAAAANEFELHYQPVVNVKSGRVASYEALIRWRDQTGRNVSPAEFIPLAEDLNLMQQIGRWVLATACSDASRWDTHTVVSVNVSATQLRDESFVQIVGAILDESGLAPSRLELEITETAIMKNVDFASEQLHKLRTMGVLLALDDFGTGYSSLSLVEKLPLTRVKIDRSFVSRLDETERSWAVAKAVVCLCRTLGISVTAEGVETRRQRKIITDLGCYEQQGFLFAKPSPQPPLLDLLRAEPRSPAANSA